jgi:lauroyl/myristoyl acyltransferase
MGIHLTKELREVEYYFLRMLFCALFRPPGAYERIIAFSRKRSIFEWRRKNVERNLEVVFGNRFSQKEREGLSGRFLEILACDDIDCYLWLLHPWSRIRKNIRIENGEIIQKIVTEKRSCVVLSAHFGGGFFVFEILKELLGKPQVIGRPIFHQELKSDIFRYLYLKLRMWCLKKTVGEKIIYTQTEETKEMFLRKLDEGYLVYVTFDVPPQFTKGSVEEVFFLNRYWKYPSGFLKLLSRTPSTIVPLFTYLTEEGTRVFTFFPEYPITEGGIKEALQKCAKTFEKFILERPEQWFFWDSAQVFWE